MSHTIEFNRWALVAQPDDTTFPREPLYFAFGEYGDNRCFGPRGVDRKVNAFQVKPYSDFMQEIVRHSAGCESGVLQVSDRRTKAETFISNWRGTADTALDMADYLKEAGSFTLRLQSVPKALASRGSAIAAKLMDHADVQVGGTEHAPDAHTIITFTPENHREIVGILCDVARIDPLKPGSWNHDFDPEVYARAQSTVSAAA